MRRTFLLAASLLLVACGSGGDHRLSKEEYAKRADAICARFNRQQPSLPSAQNVTARQVARLADRTLPLLDRSIADLRRLAPPKEEQQLADRWLAALRRLLHEGEGVLRRQGALTGVHSRPPRSVSMTGDFRGNSL